MLNYAFICTGAAPMAPAIEKADARLASRFPGSATRVVGDGQTADGARWIAVRFEVGAGASLAECVRSYLIELRRHGVAFWRIMSGV